MAYDGSRGWSRVSLWSDAWLSIFGGGGRFVCPLGITLRKGKEKRDGEIVKRETESN